MPDDIFDKAAKTAPKQDIFEQAASRQLEVPDDTAQAKAMFQPGGKLASTVQGTERAMQQTMGGPPMFVDVPAGQKQQFEQAGQKGYATGAKAGMASLAIPSLIAAPVATGTALLGGAAGGYAGQYAGKKGAAALDASPENQETAGDVGGVIGGFIGGYGGAKLGGGISKFAGRQIAKL